MTNLQLTGRLPLYHRDERAKQTVWPSIHARDSQGRRHGRAESGETRGSAQGAVDGGEAQRSPRAPLRHGTQDPHRHRSSLLPSTAILIYLSCKYPTADHWYPSNLQARARIHEYLGWHADCVRGTFGAPLWIQVRRAICGVLAAGDLGVGTTPEPTLCPSGVGTAHWGPLA